MFAAYILVPHIVLNCLEVKEDYQISELCGVSSSASLYRANDIRIWMGRKRSTEYDFLILNLFCKYIESNHKSPSVHKWLSEHHGCTTCSNYLDSAQYKFCPICGHPIKWTYLMRREIMHYSGIDVDTDGRALECPVCHNSDLYEAGYVCIICGHDLANYCSSADNDDPFTPKCNKHDPLPGNARYCPYCGAKTTFFKRGCLSSWNGEEDESDDSSELPF